MPLRRARRLPIAVLFAAALASCDEPAASSPAAAAPAPAPSAGASDRTPEPSREPPRARDEAQPGSHVTEPAPNPLDLPPRKIQLAPARRVFTFPQEMLAGAKLGTTLVLHAATALGIEGDNVLIEGKGGPPYRVHAGYVIPVPDDARVRVGDPVLAEHAGVMKHAVVTKLARGKIGLRFTDLEPRAPEVLAKGARIMKQSEGLAPGNYAALRHRDTWRHVLLVSPIDGPTKRWFALGFAGAATLADEADLRPIPVKPSLRVGDAVWAESVGVLRRGTVQALVDPGFFTVKLERAGRPVTLGWGLVTKPLE